MNDKTWKPAPSYRPKGVKLPSRVEVPNAKKLADEASRPSRGAS